MIKIDHWNNNFFAESFLAYSSPTIFPILVYFYHPVCAESFLHSFCSFSFFHLIDWYKPSLLSSQHGQVDTSWIQVHYFVHSASEIGTHHPMSSFYVHPILEIYACERESAFYVQSSAGSGDIRLWKRINRIVFLCQFFEGKLEFYWLLKYTNWFFTWWLNILRFQCIN